MEHVQDMTDERGGRTAAAMPLKGNGAAVKEVLEDRYGHRVIQARKGEQTVSGEALLKGLADDGLP